MNVTTLTRPFLTGGSASLRAEAGKGASLGTIRSCGNGWCGVLWLVLLCLPLQVVGHSSSSAVEPGRVLILGDSVARGAEGDWTWRYRLWKRLQATAAAPVDFVGPRDDLYDYLTKGFGNHEYVDPGFDADHASRAGLR